ncbi:MAG: thymidine phosphorylase [Planctomycetota bacterium]|nr:MAG: thymidine phosphorylase [Planctomycetota bacterium]
MIARWLEARRDGREQPPQEIAAFVRGVVDGSVTRAQAAAWLAFVQCRGMSAAETVALTLAMADSGARLEWTGLTGPFVDKHSTGGVGDKVSLVLAPLWAALGRKVPMLSGRGLGITGGTLDKLEAIPGFRTDLDAAALRRALGAAGCFISGQTSELAPADRILYALRNETQTVPSIPLITASILSKKLVEGIEHLVLDVKCGSGAFMQTEAEARALAESLQRVGAGAGLRTQAHVTDMSQPLGEAVGNALEVEEAVACLQGAGPRALRALVVQLSGAGADAEQALDGGAALERWRRMLRAQDGDPDAPLRGAGCRREVLLAESAGTVTRCDAGAVGRAAFVLGAGRAREQDRVHPGVGVLVHAHRGDRVQRGQPLLTLVHDRKGLEEARRLARDAVAIA